MWLELGVEGKDREEKEKQIRDELETSLQRR